MSAMSAVLAVQAVEAVLLLLLLVPGAGAVKRHSMVDGCILQRHPTGRPKPKSE